MSHTPKIAIIGAGIAGLAAARILAENFEVTVFEKSRGLGGRLSTRYASRFEFDHGVQYFTAESASFVELVNHMQAEGIVNAWQGEFVEISNNKTFVLLSDQRTRYVGVPRMNVVGKYLARGLSVLLNQRVTKLIRGHDFWQLEINQTTISEQFDWALFAIPSEQAKSLLTEATPLLGRVSSVEMQGCYVLMLGCNDTFVLPSWCGASIQNPMIQWISCNSSKPGRAPESTLVVLSNNQWAEDQINTDLQLVQSQLWTAAAQILDLSSHQIDYMSVHHWRYANCIKPLQAFELLDRKNCLALCGDWTQGAKVEAAYLSGQAVALALSTHLMKNDL
jgi:hypothetical protein